MPGRQVLYHLSHACSLKISFFKNKDTNFVIVEIQNSAEAEYFYIVNCILCILTKDYLLITFFFFLVRLSNPDSDLESPGKICFILLFY
jgi:hypothetical protein